MFRVIYTVQGVPVRLEIPEARVFVPNLVGLLSATQLRVRPGETVCDVSTGSGFHAILAAKLGAGKVFGIDLSADAVRAARRNAQANGVADRCVFLRGSLLEPLARLRRKADLIVSTLPNTPDGRLRSEPAMRKTASLIPYLGGGADGADLHVEFVRQAARRLRAGGRLHMHVVDWSNSARTLAELAARGFLLRELRRARIPAWGQRCNFRDWMAERLGPEPRRIRYDGKVGGKVKVFEASIGSRGLAEARLPAEAVIQRRFSEALA